MLSFFSASNEIVNSKKAIQACIEEALQEQEDSCCDLLIIHTTVGHNFKELLEGARALCPGATIVGCSGGGVIGKDGASEKIRTLAIMAVKGPKEEFAVSCQDQIQGKNSFEVGAKVAQDLLTLNPNLNMINILASGIDIAADRVIEGIESVVGAHMPIFGGTSADSMKLVNTFQFHNDLILERGILLIGFADPTLKMHSAASHGSRPIGKSFTVTSSHANEIQELDGEPAWPTLMQALDLSPETSAAEAIVLSALAEPVPEELKQPYGSDYKLHTIFKISDDKQSLFLPVDCSEGTVLNLVQRDEDLIFGGTDRMVQSLEKEISDKDVVAVFHTDCLARGKMGLDGIVKDGLISALQNPIRKDKDVPWLGLYGFGEFTPLAGKNHFHTQTSSLYVLVRD